MTEHESLSKWTIWPPECGKKWWLTVKIGRYPTPSVHHSVEEGLVQLLLTVHNGMGQVTKRTGGHKVVLNPESRHQEERMSSYCPSLLISSPVICCNLVYTENTRLSPTITHDSCPSRPKRLFLVIRRKVVPIRRYALQLRPDASAAFAPGAIGLRRDVRAKVRGQEIPGTHHGTKHLLKTRLGVSECHERLWIFVGCQLNLGNSWFLWKL